MQWLESLRHSEHGRLARAWTWSGHREMFGGLKWDSSLACTSSRSVQGGGWLEDCLIGHIIQGRTVCVQRQTPT